MSDHISEDLALFIAILPREDHERQTALAHAQGCSMCARLLLRGRKVLEAIASRPASADVHMRLKTRILASIERVESERSRTRWEPYALATGALLSFVVALLDVRTRHAASGLFPTHGPFCVLWQTLGATLSVATVSCWARSWTWRVSPLRVAVVSMGGGLIGQLWLRIVCPAHDALSHSFAFHVTGVLLTTTLGYGLARLRMRAASTLPPVD